MRIVLHQDQGDDPGLIAAAAAKNLREPWTNKVFICLHNPGSFRRKASCQIAEDEVAGMDHGQAKDHIMGKLEPLLLALTS